MKQKKISLRNPVVLAFLISAAYWVYLAFTARMSIAWDAIDYEHLGKMLAQQGWVEYFKTGPNREPFYPALVAISMLLGKATGLSYQLVQVVLQFFLLFLTQLLTLRLLRLLQINNLLSSLVILYLGISPAMVNSALSLFSEIATYPVILLTVILIYRSWGAFSAGKSRVALFAIITGMLFFMLIMNKAAFELITPVYFFMLLFSVLLARNRKLAVNFFLYALIFSVTFYSLLAGYKTLNRIHNGSFAVSNRAAYQLYGETAIRMRPLTAEHLFIALASIPGEGVSTFFFGKKAGRYTAERNADFSGRQKFNQMQGTMPAEKIDSAFISLTGREILKNPAQYCLFTAMEGLKMFFWESTQIGFVTYPPFLEKLFSWTPFKNGLRLGVSLLTVFSLIYLVVLLFRRRMNILMPEGPSLFLYLCLLFIFSFVGTYSLFWIIPRYALPLVPLYLIIIAYVFQDIIEKCAE